MFDHCRYPLDFILKKNKIVIETVFEYFEISDMLHDDDSEIYQSDIWNHHLKHRPYLKNILKDHEKMFYFGCLVNKDLRIAPERVQSMKDAYVVQCLSSYNVETNQEQHKTRKVSIFDPKTVDYIYEALKEFQDSDGDGRFEGGLVSNDVFLTKRLYEMRNFYQNHLRSTDSVLWSNIVKFSEYQRGMYHNEDILEKSYRNLISYSTEGCVDNIFFGENAQLGSSSQKKGVT